MLRTVTPEWKARNWERVEFLENSDYSHENLPFKCGVNEKLHRIVALEIGPLYKENGDFEPHTESKHAKILNSFGSHNVTFGYESPRDQLIIKAYIQITEGEYNNICEVLRFVLTAKEAINDVDTGFNMHETAFASESPPGTLDLISILLGIMTMGVVAMGMAILAGKIVVPAAIANAIFAAGAIAVTYVVATVVTVNPIFQTYVAEPVGKAVVYLKQFAQTFFYVTKSSSAQGSHLFAHIN